jgi:LDH2 family malate/lactate/ureidoglycolate dehydrogenase
MYQQTGQQAAQEANVTASEMGTVRVTRASLVELATQLFVAAGLDLEKAAATARLLVLTDMMGRVTHGLSQVDNYLSQLSAGTMTRDGEAEIVTDRGNILVLDGGYRPGLWLVDKTMRTGIARARDHGVFTCAIRRSHHIGCLAALAKTCTDAGLFVLLASSGPHSKIVAPFGGKTALFSPNPIAVGFPATSAPILVDISASITTVSMTREKHASGLPFDHPWLLDADGKPTRDASVLENTTPRGSLLLLGGAEAGHKGFGLALMVEALTQGLAGYGRRDQPTNWGAGVYLQIMDPAAFAGADAFTAQMDFLIDQCHANAPIDADAPVRLPGERANRLIADAEAYGVPIRLSTIASLRTWSTRLSVACPL